MTNRNGNGRLLFGLVFVAVFAAASTFAFLYTQQGTSGLATDTVELESTDLDTLQTGPVLTGGEDANLDTVSE